MKAFKQINFHTETRFFWSYAFALCTLSIFIIISPVLAQTIPTEEKFPEIRVDVKKEYDEEGNVIRFDSSRTWCWYGKEFSIYQHDSIFNEIEKNMGSFFHRNHSFPFGSFDLPSGPPLHRFWNWNESDSTVTSFLEKFKGEEFYNFCDPLSNPNLQWNFPFQDSIDLADHFINPNFNEDFFEKHLKEMQDFSTRLRQYQKEHQELLEKFFDQTGKNEDIDPHVKPNLNIPNKRHEVDKTGNI